jgi:hypothetical protein
MLLSCKIIIKLDHKNLTRPTLTHTSDHVLCQCLLLKEYRVELQYIQGENNVVTDALSHLPTQELFSLEADHELPLNLALNANKQTVHKPLLSTLT